MPRITRSRTIAAPPREVWELVSDPSSLPRWWPRATRVEAVEEGRWTKVLATGEGRGVRADFRRAECEDGRRYAWEQELAGTPFARHLRASTMEIELRPEGEGTEVSLTSAQALRGLSRLGSPLMRGGQGRMLEEALEGLERALGRVK